MQLLLLLNFLIHEKPFINTLIGLCITGVVASATVSGKAMGKFFAISKCNSIIFFVARIGAFSIKIKVKRKCEREF